MKKFLCLTLCVILCLGILTGCGKKYNVSDSTIFVEKKGAIVATDVQTFDASKYSEEDLEKFVDEQIDAYNDKAGDDVISLKSLEVEEGVCTLVIKYDSYEHFAKFNGYEIFVGSVAEALAAGYTFDDVAFASVKDETATECDKSSFMDSDEEYKVVIFKNEPYSVHTYGDVQFVSTEHTKIVDENTISFALGNHLQGTKAPSTESTEQATETTESTEGNSASDGSVTDEELEGEGETSTEEMVFPFDEQPKDESIAESLGYVYIIFK